MASFMKKIGFLPVACVLGFCLFGGGFLFVFNKDSSLTVIILQLIQGTERKGRAWEESDFLSALFTVHVTYNSLGNFI